MKKVIKLYFIDVLRFTLSQNNGLIQVLIGLRQVGKTTTVLHFFKTHFKDQFLYESADEVFNSTAQWLSELWGKAIQVKKIECEMCFIRIQLLTNSKIGWSGLIT